MRVRPWAADRTLEGRCPCACSRPWWPRWRSGPPPPPPRTRRSTPGPPNSASDAVKLIYEDYRRDGKIDVCEHERADLQDALDTIEPDFDTDYPDFREAVEAGVTRHDDGRCDADATPTATATATATASPTATADDGTLPPPTDDGSTDDGTLPPPDDGTTTPPPDDGVLPDGRERPVRGHADPGSQRRAAGRPGHRPARRVGGRRRRRRSPRPRTGARCSSRACWLRSQLLARLRSSSSDATRRPGARPDSAPAQRGRISPTGCA